MMTSLRDAIELYAKCRKKPKSFWFEIEQRQKAVLLHEEGRKSPCLKCKDECPGFQLHYWRKVCINCQCPKDDHALHLRQLQHQQQRPEQNQEEGIPKIGSLFLKNEEDATTMAMDLSNDSVPKKIMRRSLQLIPPGNTKNLCILIAEKLMGCLSPYDNVNVINKNHENEQQDEGGLLADEAKARDEMNYYNRDVFTANEGEVEAEYRICCDEMLMQMMTKIAADDVVDGAWNGAPHKNGGLQLFGDGNVTSLLENEIEIREEVSEKTEDNVSNGLNGHGHFGQHLMTVNKRQSSLRETILLHKLQLQKNFNLAYVYHFVIVTVLSLVVTFSWMYFSV